MRARKVVQLVYEITANVNPLSKIAQPFITTQVFTNFVLCSASINTPSTTLRHLHNDNPYFIAPI